MINKSDFKNVKKILVIELKHIGDVVLTIPVFRALKEKFPNAHIAALVNSGTEDVLAGNPLIDEIVLYDRSIKEKGLLQKITGELLFAKNIRNQGFDMTVDLTSGDRAATISLISGARYRLGKDPVNRGFWGKKFLYTHISENDWNKHAVIQNLDAVRQFNIDTDNLSLDLHIPEDANIFVQELLSKNNIESGETIVHIHPTSRWIFKCWKDEYMAELITRLSKEGIKVIVTSSPDKRETDRSKNILSLVASINPDSASKVIDLCGKTDIKQLAAISKASDLFFGVDSAPMHIAAAVGTPVVAIFGPTGVFNWAPWHARGGKNPHIVVRKGWDCEPCGAGLCENNISKCLYEITPSEVIEKLKECLPIHTFNN